MRLSRHFTIFKTRLRIRYKHRYQFWILRQTIQLGEKVLEGNNDGLHWNENDHFSKLVILFLAKNLQRLKSVHILCRKGFAKDAVPLLRTMFEELVDLKYIHSNKKLIADYFDYDMYLRLRLGRILMQHGGKIIDKDKLRVSNVELENKWNMIKSRFTYTRHDGKEKVCNRWTCKNVEQVSNEVGFAGAYAYIFGFLSHYIHSTTISATDYVLGRDEEGVIIEIGPSPQLVEQVLATARYLFTEILNIVNNEYKMKFDTELKKLSQQLVNESMKYDM